MSEKDFFRTDPEFRSPIVEKSLELPIPSDIALHGIVRSLEKLYLDVFEEEGEARVYFDLTDFPPDTLPRGVTDLKSTLTTGTELETHQIATLTPYREYYNEPFYLLGELRGDADQLSPLFKEARQINPGFSILTIHTNPQDPSYHHYRLPEISLHAVRYHSAVLQFMINKDDFQPNKELRSDIDQVLSTAVEAFTNIQSSPHYLRDLTG